MDISQERDLAELTRRLDYLLTTNELSDTDKIAILMVKVPIYLEQGIRSHVAREVIESADGIICLVQRSFPARS